jgi:hypothetical protein
MDSTRSVHALTLPFGKHKGRPLGDVPGDYLRWMLRECKLSSGLRAAVGAELATRAPTLTPVASVWAEATPIPPWRHERRLSSGLGRDGAGSGGGFWGKSLRPFLRGGNLRR